MQRDASEKSVWQSRRRQTRGMVIGGLVGAALLVGFALPGQAWWRSRGPMTPGHGEVECGFCHLPAAGTVRQQLQANSRAALGLRAEPVPFGLLPVANPACISCHERPDDVHPVFRFMEPRFAEAREAIAPQLCTSCHVEHQGRRVSVEPTYCARCHAELEVPSDPLDVSHAELIRTGNWQSCLGCHDYHGNHVMKPDTLVGNAASLQRILAYFGRGASPYGDSVYVRARKEPARR